MAKSRKKSAKSELELVSIDEFFQDVGEEITPPHVLLASHIRNVWSVNSRSKLVPEQEMLDGLRRIKREYPPEHLAAIREAGLSEDFIGLTYHKCRDCASWMLDTIDPMGDRTWDVEIDGVIEIPPEMKADLVEQKQMEMLQEVMRQAEITGQQLDPAQVISFIESQEEQVEHFVIEEAKAEAEERCTNMERLIMSQLHQGGWEEAYKACVDDFSKFKACVMKGPLPKRVKGLKWNDGSKKYEVADQIIPGFWRVSPFNAYPAPNALSPNDGPFIEIEPYDPADLSALIGQPGYDEDALRSILQNYPSGHKETTVIDAERKWLENEDLTGVQNAVEGGKIDCINFWGDVQGRVLRAWGMDESKVPDEDKYYPVNAKMVGETVFRAILNPDPLGRKPYGSASFVKNNDSMWGESPADLMKGIQEPANATIRAIINNVAWSSGPVWEYDETRMSADDNGDIYPGKKIATNNKRMAEGPAIRMYQANLNAQELIQVYMTFKKEADDQVVPAFANQAAGGERTSSALAMRMGASGRNIKMAVDNFDSGVTIPRIEMLFAYNMLHSKDESIKGSTKVVARSTKSQAAREQMAIRHTEFISMIASNPELTAIVGKKGLAYAIAEGAKARQMDVAKLLPNLEQIEREPNKPAGMMQGQAQAPAPAETTLDVAGNPAGGVEYQQGAQ